MIKNILFDFGNVLGNFDLDEIMFSCIGKTDEKLKEIIFHDWDAIDDGTIEYNEYVQKCMKMTEDSNDLEIFFNNWYLKLKPIEEIHEWIKELKDKGYALYVLSNAPTIFEDHVDSYPIMKYFDGRVFSASIHLSKPDLKIYEYILNKYRLDASECLFIDDKPENIRAAIQVGMKSMVYHNNLDEIKKVL